MILPGWIGKTYHRMNRKMAFISGISGVKRDGEMKKNMMVFWICLLLGILSMIYAVMVHATGSGTAFFLIWIGIGIVVFLFGISVYMEVWKKVPHPVKIFAGMIVCIGLLVFCIVEGCVISQMHADGRGGPDRSSPGAGSAAGSETEGAGASPPFFKSAVVMPKVSSTARTQRTQTRTARFCMRVIFSFSDCIFRLINTIPLVQEWESSSTGRRIHSVSSLQSAAIKTGAKGATSSLLP